MATQTSHYHWTLPATSDAVDISVLNNNFSGIDDTIYSLSNSKADYYVIENNADLNTLLAPGIYRSSHANADIQTYINLPVGLSIPFTLIVTGPWSSATTGITQTILSSQLIASRRGSSGGLGGWVKYANYDEIQDKISSFNNEDTNYFKSESEIISAIHSNKYLFFRARQTNISSLPVQYAIGIGISWSVSEVVILIMNSGGTKEEYIGYSNSSNNIIWTKIINENDEFVMSISNNTDLNLLYKRGIHISPTTTSGVATLINKPSTVTTPFTMIITGNGSNAGGCIQTIITDGKIINRRGTSGGWGSWYQFTGTVI